MRAILAMLFIATAALFYEMAVLAPERKAREDEKVAAAIKAAEEERAAAEAKAAADLAARIKADRCNPDVALRNINFVNRQAGGVIGWSTERFFPVVFMPEALWVAMDSSAQSGLIAAFDCAFAGPGRHLPGLRIASGQGMKPYAQFEDFELMRAREQGWAVLSEPLN